MNPTFKIFLRTEAPKKNGSIPVYLRIHMNREKKDYSLGVSVFEPEKYWDASQNRVKRCSFVDMVHINKTIEDAMDKAGDVIREMKRSNEPLTLSTFDQRFKNPTEIKESFFSFAEKTIKDLTQKKASKETIRSYNSYVSKLKIFRPTLSFGEITLEFIQDYHRYMINLGNKPNTVHKSLSFIRTVLNKAINEGIIQVNVFRTKSYKLIKVPGIREFLTVDELKNIENLFSSGSLKKYQANTCRYFLFSCYTGLRYQDIKNLRFVDLKEEIHSKRKQTFVRITMHKVKDPVSIPLIKKAVKLIGKGFEQEKVFHVASNQVCNRYLKEVISLAGIQKNITFHSARHTFATTGLTVGIPAEVISKLLGHHDLQTTMIYSKIVDNLKIEQMEKWNKL